MYSIQVILDCPESVKKEKNPLSFHLAEKLKLIKEINPLLTYLWYEIKNEYDGHPREIPAIAVQRGRRREDDGELYTNCRVVTK